MTEQKLTKGQQAMAAVIDLMLASGFRPDGETHQETVRVPTKDSPLYGRSGGQLATFGGRQRFAKDGTTVKATVGIRTTAIYRIEGPGLNGVRGIATCDTKDFAAIQAAVAAL